MDYVLWREGGREREGEGGREGGRGRGEKRESNTWSKQLLSSYIPQCIHIWDGRVLILVHFDKAFLQLHFGDIDAEVHHVGITSNGPQQRTDSTNIQGFPLVCVRDQLHCQFTAGSLHHLTNLRPWDLFISSYTFVSCDYVYVCVCIQG